MNPRALALAVVTLACVAGATTYALASGGAGPKVAAGLPVAAPASRAAPGAPVPAPSSGSILIVGADPTKLDTLGGIAVVPGKRLGTRRFVPRPDLRCVRIHFGGRRGICLTWGGGFGSLYSARLLDANFNVTGKIALDGAPSRARVSPDGRYAAATTFVSGHSYSEPGGFATRTLLIDMEGGSVIADLEKFTVLRDGERVDAPDVNFWGVTFARDSNRFYATMATGGMTYLIEGDVAARSARTLRENVECPSLSPDGTRIAYKKLVGLDANGGRTWNLHVVDLRTMRDTAIADRAPVDDQAEWLGERILYNKGDDVWAAPSDGTGVPTLLLAGALSPAVVG